MLAAFGGLTLLGRRRKKKKNNLKMIIILTGQANKFSLPCCTYIFNRSRDNMTIYNLNFGIGWASSGVEYAQLYRRNILHDLNEDFKFIFWIL